MTTEGCYIRKDKFSPECGKPAVARRGLKCTNGCLGEGAFDYACKDDRDFLEKPDRNKACIVCGHFTIISFEIQELKNA